MGSSRACIGQTRQLPEGRGGQGATVAPEASRRPLSASGQLPTRIDLELAVGAAQVDLHGLTMTNSAWASSLSLTPPRRPGRRGPASGGAVPAPPRGGSRGAGRRRGRPTPRACSTRAWDPSSTWMDGGRPARPAQPEGSSTLASAALRSPGSFSVSSPDGALYERVTSLVMVRGDLRRCWSAMARAQQSALIRGRVQAATALQ
jgi:hypothetical protein